MKKIIKAVDLFCGAGGESTGLHQAIAHLGLELQLLAINHWDIAIETHTANHPGTKHLCESIAHVKPRESFPSGKLDLLWASPECTHHSNARGGKPKSDQSRASVKLIMKWITDLDVSKIIIENVSEFQSWGPLDEEGYPIKERKGEFFHGFLDDLRELGYSVDYRVLCAADYGDPTTRKRLFIQAVKSHKIIDWPIFSHSKKSDMFTTQKWRSARSIIDWSIESKSIFGRKKPLVPNTIARIEAGIKKYWGEYAEPFLIVLRGTSERALNGTALSIDGPLPTITANGLHVGVVEPFIITSGHTSSIRTRSLNEPLTTVVTKAEHCLCSPVIAPFIMDQSRPKFGHTGRVYSCDEPIRTVTTRNNMSIVEPFIIPYYGASKAVSIEDPLDTVTTKDRFALIEGNLYTLDIRYRMLKPHELALGQGFPKDYKFHGNGTEITKQIGNAVPVGTAKALCVTILKDAV